MFLRSFYFLQDKKVDSFVTFVNGQLRQRQENERLKTIIARIESYDPVVRFLAFNIFINIDILFMLLVFVLENFHYIVSFNIFRKHEMKILKGLYRLIAALILHHLCRDAQTIRGDTYYLKETLSLKKAQQR